MNGRKESDLTRKVLLSVAGFDPTFGAGIGLDLKVFQELGFQGVAILTSLTSQNTKGISEFRSLPPEFLWNQYQTLINDITISGIKVGMIGSRKNMRIVAQILANHPRIPRILDPVLKSSSGSWLMEEKAIPEYIKEFRGKVTLLTPNLEEASMISGIAVNKLDDMKKAAKIIFKRTQCLCLIKGGHLKKDISDILFDGEQYHVFKMQRLEKKVHGTGCFLSSTLLANFVEGMTPEQAVREATKLTHKAMKGSVQVGQGQHIIDFPIPFSPPHPH